MGYGIFCFGDFGFYSCYYFLWSDGWRDDVGFVGMFCYDGMVYGVCVVWFVDCGGDCVGVGWRYKGGLWDGCVLCGFGDDFGYLVFDFGNMVSVLDCDIYGSGVGVNVVVGFV